MSAVETSGDLRGRHLHFDPGAGIAGDMTVAALVDAGVPRAIVEKAVKAMAVPGLRVRFERRKRGAFVGLGFNVTWPGFRQRHDHPSEPHGHHHDDHHGHEHEHEHEHGHEHHHHGPSKHGHEHRDYAEIKRLLRRAALGKEIKELAGDIFERLARAEAALHGVPVERVTFHEVGAFDSIADVVAAAAALTWLAPVSVTSAPPVLGSGTVRTAHGRVSVPAPATAALLRGIPVRPEGVGELTTPTGAAILGAVVREFREMPPVRIQAQGFGAGTRELADRPNVLRVLIGEPLGVALPPSSPTVVVLQSNLDDMSPQLVEPLMSALFAAGALDVWVTPILMKKGRPAIEVSALAEPATRASVAGAFLEHSTTLGIRQTEMMRTVLARSEGRAKTRFGTVRVKIAAQDGGILRAAPEFEDCRRLAERLGVPVRQVLIEAAAEANSMVVGRERAPARNRREGARSQRTRSR